MAASPIVHYQDLSGTELDFIAVQNWGGVRAMTNAIDPKVGPGVGRTDGKAAVGHPLHDRVTRLDPFPFEYDGTVGCRTYDRLTGSDGHPPAADFKVHHE